ncbi:golgin subfamily A member 6-like protein 10 isoform X1 [Trachinotus anak]|uniref:golgin subfamily A member 6-like protein 10 isoform X1 n=1 Tax=Trachinotus anak TaxID=443729 RepID=UPI0039F20325
MEIINTFKIVYNMFDNMKNNDQQCPHVLERLKALENLLVFIQQKTPDQLSDDVKEGLEKLSKTVSSAEKLIRKFTDTHKLNHVVKASDYKLEFENLNKSLTDTFVILSGALHVHQENKLDEQEKKLEEQEIKLTEQEKKLDEQEIKLEEQENKLEEQENKLEEQELKLAKQERRMAEQEDKIAEQEDILLRVESNIAYESRAYYCILQ